MRLSENLLKCKRNIYLEERFYLILQKDISDDEADFKLLEPMVPARMQRIRWHVNKGVCWKTNSCPKVAVKVAKHQVVDVDSDLFFTICRIQTKLKRDEYKVEWIFENNILKTDNNSMFVSESPEGLFLTKTNPQFNNSGLYTCKVTVKVITVLNDRYTI